MTNGLSERMEDGRVVASGASATGNERLSYRWTKVSQTGERAGGRNQLRMSSRMDS
ncbi:hypothetical protein KSK37_08140 [Kaistella sp. DKR-2]|uniref:hypothetical protein n=1 Tax=Kaistella soli TaxID=2849654 RepID=UPI001C256C6A|nr:hypothetical protein [Kaistella soli]MBU8883048.1 hypothetical protein [Kaistella soli]